MSKSTLLIVGLLVSLLYAAFKLGALSRQNGELASKNQDLQAQLDNVRAQLLKEHMKDQTELFEAQTAVEQLQGRIKTQRELVSAAEQRLKQEQNGGTGGKQIPALREKLASQKQLIDDFEQRLREVRSRQAQLQNQDRYYQQQAGLTQKQTDEQLKTQIVEQERVLKQMQNDLQTYKRSVAVNPDYASKYSETQANIEVQKNTIQQLKDQRSSSGTQWGFQKASSHNQSALQLSQLKSTEQELQAQLLREKAAHQMLNSDIQNGVQTQKSQEALIQTAEADFRNQKAKLQDLQSQLDEAQKRLDQLSAQSTGQAGGGVLPKKIGAAPPASVPAAVGDENSAE